MKFTTKKEKPVNLRITLECYDDNIGAWNDKVFARFQEQIDLFMGHTAREYWNELKHTTVESV